MGWIGSLVRLTIPIFTSELLLDNLCSLIYPQYSLNHTITKNRELGRTPLLLFRLLLFTFPFEFTFHALTLVLLTPFYILNYLSIMI